MDDPGQGTPPAGQPGQAGNATPPPAVGTEDLSGEIARVRAQRDELKALIAERDELKRQARAAAPDGAPAKPATPAADGKTQTQPMDVASLVAEQVSAYRVADALERAVVEAGADRGVVRLFDALPEVKRLVKVEGSAVNGVAEAVHALREKYPQLFPAPTSPGGEAPRKGQPNTIDLSKLRKGDIASMPDEQYRAVRDALFPSNGAQRGWGGR